MPHDCALRAVGRYLLAVAIGLVFACSPSGAPNGDTPPPDATPPPDTMDTMPLPGTTPENNAAPTAGFTRTATATAGDVLVFDAATSSDPEGLALAYHWTFGDERFKAVFRSQVSAV